MGFDVGADAYGRFMGRYSEPLAGSFADLALAGGGRSALDVGCGPGALTAVLADRLGSAAVGAVDPSAPFVAALRARLPGVDVRRAGAEQLPFEAASFDLVLAQLVVHFLADPVAGIREMARVARPGGTVAACVWDYAAGLGPLATFWRAAHDLDPDVRDESALPGGREGHLLELFRRAGLDEAAPTTLSVSSSFAGVDEWWEPFTLGVGPAGDHVASLTPGQRDALRARCAELLPDGAFEIRATAWTVSARV